jgi:uncharacterized protein
MSQIEATKKSDLITLPRSPTGLVQGIGLVPTVISLKAIGVQMAHNYTAAGSVPGLQDTFLSIYADGADFGIISGANASDVTGAVKYITVSTAGSGYTSAPTVSFTASTLVGSFTVTAGGSGYTLPPTVSFSGGGGSGALAVAVVNTAGQVTRVTIACMGGGYTSAPSVSFSGGGSGAGGAAATAVLATPTATATISAGQVTAIAVTDGGAGYGSAGAAVVTISGGGGSGATATATVVLNFPNLSAVGVGNGNAGGAPGICQRLPASQGQDAFARTNDDAWIGIVGASAGTVRIFRSSY